MCLFPKFFFLFWLIRTFPKLRPPCHYFLGNTNLANKLKKEMCLFSGVQKMIAQKCCYFRNVLIPYRQILEVIPQLSLFPKGCILFLEITAFANF